MTPRDSKEAGFTLIELVIAAVLLVLIVAAIGLFLRGAVGRSSAYKEASTLDERRSVLSSLMQADFDKAGRGLVQSASGGSGTEDLSFTANDDFESYPGYLYRHSDTNSEAIFSTRALGGGTGQFKFVPQGSRGGRGGVNVEITLTGSAGLNGETRSISIRGASWTISENGRVISSSDSHNEAGPHEEGDAYIFSIENSERGIRTVSYFRERGESRVLLYAGESECPSYPVGLAVTRMNVGNALLSMIISGAPIVNRDATPPLLALMPFDYETGNRLVGPVEVSEKSNSVKILSADENTDPFYLSYETHGNTSSFYTHGLTRGTLNEGDIVFLSDFSANHAAMYRVLYYNPDDGLIKVEAITRDKPAWNRFWYDESDYSDHDFPPGTSIVKLAPFVEWRAALTDGGQTVLQRRSGLEPWTTVDFDVTNFRVAETVASDGTRSYDVFLELISEGVEVGGSSGDIPRQEVSLNLAPRALGRGFVTNR